MTRIEWEFGSIKLPVESYRSIKHSVVRTFNLAVRAEYQLAYDAYYAAKKARKEATDKRGFSEIKWITSHKKFSKVAAALSGKNPRNVYLPRKKNYRTTANKGDIFLDFGIASISFQNSNYLVDYKVSPGDLACEKARKLPCVNILLDALRTVHWAPNTGGIIYGNDEFNQRNTNFD